MQNFIDHLGNWLQHDTALINSPNPLLVLAVILIVGFVFSRLARKLKIPTVTMQILGGFILGHYVLNLFRDEAYVSFEPITNFALGFIGLTIGSHLNFRKLHNAGKRIILITLTDVILTPVIVFSALYWLAGLQFEISLLIAVIAITTAPGSTLHIVKEKRAKGIFTKTILAVVAFNNVLTILIFYIAYYFLYYRSAAHEFSLLGTIGNPLLLLMEALLVGGSVGYTVIYFTEKRKTTISFLTMVILAVIVTVGTSQLLHLSGILSSLILGMVITNFSKYKSVLFGAFKDIEIEVFTLFFVLAGTHLDIKVMAAAGFAGLILIISRLIGKTLGPFLGAHLANSIPIIKKNIGIALYPIAGVAIGLILLLENDPIFQVYSSEITAIVLTAVIVNELLGPVFTGKAIKNAGEEHKNRVRLMDFLQEEFIKIDITSHSKWEALDEMAEFMYKTHKVREISLQELKLGIIEREKEISTGIGDGLAIPHAIIDGGPKIRGVIGVSKDGIEFDSIDGKPVKLLFLIATPRKNYELHLHMLANIAKIFGHHPHITDQIIKARSSEEVFEILQAEEIEALNPFFED